jgi:hypothetical protein
LRQRVFGYTTLPSEEDVEGIRPESSSVQGGAATLGESGTDDVDPAPGRNSGERIFENCQDGEEERNEGQRASQDATSQPEPIPQTLRFSKWKKLFFWKKSSRVDPDNLENGRFHSNDDLVGAPL